MKKFRFFFLNVTLKTLLSVKYTKRKNKKLSITWKFLGYFALQCDVYSCAVTVGTEKIMSVNFISFFLSLCASKRRRETELWWNKTPADSLFCLFHCSMNCNFVIFFTRLFSCKFSYLQFFLLLLRHSAVFWVWR